MPSAANPLLAILFAVLGQEPLVVTPQIKKPPVLPDSEIRKGKWTEPLEFGDLLFRGVIGEPVVSASGLIYSYNNKSGLVFTEIDLGLLKQYRPAP